MKTHASQSFKTCPACGKCWSSRNDLLSDPTIRLLGFQPGANGFRSGLFLFHHRTCGTTLATELGALESLSRLPVFALSQCTENFAPAYCLARLGGKPCPLYCVCEFVSEVLAIIRQWPKDRAY
jgi:hypothetical protein